MNARNIFIGVSLFIIFAVTGCAASPGVPSQVPAEEQPAAAVQKEFVETGDEASESEEQREQERAVQKKLAASPDQPQIDAKLSVSALSRYRDYSSESFKAASGKKRVYFFHAKWCPSCKAADAEFTKNLDKIPEDAVLFKTDYDAEAALKKQYNITYQHTFVWVDAAGKEIKKWNGGALDQFLENVQMKP